ncbi:SCP domain-containing protein [Trichostrongylus colubriformis]|uniref:SCP domain-containing protein n=1 Tax=Trichostrongylus colubriformis TaxID=6319 RepID=A0AAN8ISK5_TRICO
MSYSMDLENAAQAYANTCPSSRSSYMGETFVSFPTNTRPFYDCAYDAIRSFWSPIRMWGIDQNVMFTNAVLGTGLINFSQMAWAKSYQIGCGIQRCGMNTVVVCRYYPRGNILNQRIYGLGRFCTACPYKGCTTDYMHQGLCSNPTQV